MDVDSQQVIGGFPLHRIRDMVRRLQDMTFTIGQAADRLGLSAQEAQTVIEGLQTGGLRRTSRRGRPVPPDNQGNALSQVTFIKRMSREKASTLLAEVVQRARVINKRTDLTHTVKEVIVFGSYLTDSQTLGDLDLVIRLAHRFSPGERVAANNERARKSGRRFSSFLQKLFYGETEVRRMIKNRSPYISLHTEDELKQLATVSRVVFRADGISDDPWIDVDYDTRPKANSLGGASKTGWGKRRGRR